LFLWGPPGVPKLGVHHLQFQLLDNTLSC
jgi:hypothetical protein